MSRHQGATRRAEARRRYDNAVHNALTIPVEERLDLGLSDLLALSARAERVLASVKITTVGQLASKSMSELGRLHNFGRVTIDDCAIMLRDIGVPNRLRARVDKIQGPTPPALRSGFLRPSRTRP